MSTSTSPIPPAGASAEAPPAIPPVSDQSPATTPPVELSAFEQEIADLGDDPAKLRELLLSKDKALSSVNHESMTRRQELKQLKQQLADAEKERLANERAKMSESERLQSENKELNERLASLEEKASHSEARAGFMEAGVSDLDSVNALWKMIPAADRALTTPTEWAAALKKEKPHLFQSDIPAGTPPPRPGGLGPNPLGETPRGNPGPEPVNMHPKTKAEIAALRQRFREEFSS